MQWVVTLGALALAACGSGDTRTTSGSVTPGGSAAPASAPAAQGGAAACTDAHTRIPEGGFCIEVPKDWKPKQETRADITDFGWTAPDGAPTVTLNRKKKSISGAVEFTAKNGETVSKGDLVGGQGKWALMLGKGGDNDLDSRYEVQVLGAQGLLTCTGVTSPKKAQRFVDVCRSILPLPS